MRDPLLQDDEARAALEVWYASVVTSTGEDPTGKTINHTDDWGWSFLFMCAYYDRPRCLVKLLLLGADPDVRLTATGRSPFEVALEENRYCSHKVLAEPWNKTQLEVWDEDPSKLPREVTYTEAEDKPKRKRAPTRASAKAAALLAGPEESFEEMATALFERFGGC